MGFISSNQRVKPYLPDSRLLSGFELALGAAIVIGYNVFHVIPNEVPILVVLGLLSVRLRNGGFSALGFKRPDSWKRVILIALGAAALRIALAAIVIDPLTERIWPPAVAPAGVDAITGNPLEALRWLAIVWSFAAFGEEIVYRGYLLTRAADLGQRTKVAYWAGMILVSVLFGIGHYYKGPAGMVDSGFAGLMFGIAYLFSGRNLWASILAHGLVDSFGVVMLYFGLAS
ncbi:MAG: CPBP family intramembrane glutamic endopeptidase [Acidobacteriota bacterium]